MAGRFERPGADPDDWFAEAEPAGPGREARQEARAESDEPPPARDDWLTGADAHAGEGAGLGLLHTLSEWRLVVGIVALAALLLAGLAVGGVFNTGKRTPAAVTQPPTTAPATTTRQTTTTAPATTPAGTSGPTTTLKPGDNGSEVTTLQQALNHLGYSVGTVDGVYGPSTQAAVAKFQTASNLTSDGIFGPATLAAFTSALQGP
jgi:Putative peptidoglycan binding domain